MIGLVLCYKGTNFGMMLQAYATVKYLNSIGYETEIIDYAPVQRNSNYIKKARWIFNRDVVRSKMVAMKRKMMLKKHHDIALVHKLRAEGNRRFILEHMGRTHRFLSIEDLHIKSSNYSAVIVGSDQQWNPGTIYSSINTLMFASKGITRISYATSFGISKISRSAQKRAKEFLSQIDFLSVREETGKNIIYDVCNRDALVTVDPTFLLTEEEWASNLGDIFNPLVKGDYILTYFLGGNGWHRNEVKELKQSANMKIVSIKNIESYCIEDSLFADSEMDVKTPFEFLNLIKNAKYVCTDSFHGTIFSIIFNISFFTFFRYKDSDKNSRNSRITDFLKRIGMDDRIIIEKHTIKNIFEEIPDFNEAMRIIGANREESRRFIQEALKKGDSLEKY